MDSIVDTAFELLEQNQEIVIAVIISQQGSAPRMAGARMLILRDGRIFGTIGGGLLEARTMEAAREMPQDSPGRILSFDLTNEDAAAMEMICGGRVRVLLDHILPTEENRTLFSMWRDAIAREEKPRFVSAVTTEGETVTHVSHGLLDDSGVVHGQLPISAETCEQLLAATAGGSGISVQTLEKLLLVTDFGFSMPVLYIFGAGHVAKPTAEIASLVGFRVEVLDDRAEFANKDRFPKASAIHVLPGFDHADTGLAIQENAHIVIVTRGHLHDKTVLAQALQTKASYIGMIGSSRKRDTVYKELLNEGFSENDLLRVHCPIGLAIEAETPEEIAVSIVAEMISVRKRAKRPNFSLSSV